MISRKYFFKLLIGVCLIPMNGYAQMSVDEAAVVFNAEPEVSNIRLSPDGNKILMLQMYQGERILLTKSLVDPNGSPNGILIAEGDYSWADWATNDRIVAGITHDDYRYEAGRVYSLQNSLIAVDWTGADQISLAHDGGGQFFYDLEQGGVGNWLTSEPDYILVVVVGDLFKVNIRTNEYERYYKPSGKKDYFFQIDEMGVVRYITGRTKDNGDQYDDRYRRNENDQWQNVFDDTQNENMNPMRFEGLSENDDIIYISKRDENNIKSLYLYNVMQRKLLEKVINNNQQDIYDFEITNDGRFRSYKFFDGRVNTVYVDETSARVAKIISSSLPGSNSRIVSRSDDNLKFVIVTSSPQDPNTYYLLDLTQNTMELIDNNFKSLDVEKLSPMEIINYRARDDKNIQGFLSLPIGSKKKNFPTVIFPHEGPEINNYWGFDPLVQFLTSQGYAVLLMNFRGSTGYGKDFLDLGKEEWGNKLLEDINDGAHWMIEQGYSDQSKICIYGERFGGYAALQAAAIESSLYKCSATTSPITDLFPKYKRLIRGTSMGAVHDYLERHTDRSYTRDKFKNFRKKDHWGFDEVSPLHNIDKLNLPVLMMHYDEGYYTVSAQYSHFYKEMVGANKKIERVDFNDEKYESANLEVEKFRVLGKFLAKHLKD